MLELLWQVAVDMCDAARHASRTRSARVGSMHGTRAARCCSMQAPLRGLARQMRGRVRQISVWRVGGGWEDQAQLPANMWSERWAVERWRAQVNSSQFKSSQAKSSQIKPSQAKSRQVKPSQGKSSGRDGPSTRGMRTGGPYPTCAWSYVPGTSAACASWRALEESGLGSDQGTREMVTPGRQRPSACSVGTCL